MANPNNALGTNAAFGGRTSVNAFNDVLGAFDGGGILSGWACSPSSGMTVQLGGDGETRDVAIAVNNAGNKTTVNNISGVPVEISMAAAPTANSRIDLIVAYIEDSPSSDAVTDNYDVVNLLAVTGAAASSPVAPSDSAIRAAITADGASGATAYYVVLASVTISRGTTDIDAAMITQGGVATLRKATVTTDSIADAAVTADKIDFTTIRGASGLLPVAETTTLVSDSGYAIRLTRIADFVFASSNTVGNTRPAADSVKLNTKIPEGFRPMVKTVFNWTGVVASNVNMGIDIGTDGTESFSTHGWSGTTRLVGSACWLTTDDWPS